jgi:hypothetical protein
MTMKKRLLLFAGSLLFLPSFAVAQAATTQQLDYFRFMLLNLGHLSDPVAIQRFEKHLSLQFGLNQQEVAQIDSAGHQMRSLLDQIQQSLAAIPPGTAGASPSAATQVANLTAQREAMIATLTNQILSSVRPETAALLRTPGTIVANAVYGYRGN